MGLPAMLKNFNVFAEGNSWLGLVSEVSLPEIKVKTEEWRGGGMPGPIDIPMGFEKLELEIKLGGLVVGAMRQFGRIGVSGAMLRYAGAYQEDVGGGVLAAELVTRGLQVAYNPGSAKTATATEQTVKSTLSYLKWTVNGRTEIELDMLNNIAIFDGVDLMADIRSALQQ